ncbi:TIGR02391 family protein [Rhodococcus sp. DN22]|uniref:TIGR02391 family protein n=1 Tax=Rhodococcus TaxID=1827 RepID=UPI0030CA96C7
MKSPENPDAIHSVVFAVIDHLTDSVSVDLIGVDVEWVKAELKQLVEQLAPVDERRQLGTTSRLTGQKTPACGRDIALAAVERIRPLFDRLYPQWQTENRPDELYEFGVVRDAAVRLFARIDSHEKVLQRVGGADPSPRLSAAQLHPLIWQAAKAQWSTDHFHEVVLAAAKAVNSQLQAKINRRDVAEQSLINEAFSESVLARDEVRGEVVDAWNGAARPGMLLAKAGWKRLWDYAVYT